MRALRLVPLSSLCHTSEESTNHGMSVWPKRKKTGAALTLSYLFAPVSLLSGCGLTSASVPLIGPQCFQCGNRRCRQAQHTRLFVRFVCPGLLFPREKQQKVCPWLDLLRAGRLE